MDARRNGFFNAERLKKNHDFKRAYSRGRRAAGRLLALYAYQNGLPRNRLGVVSSKKTGSAVTRNRVKRRMREAFRRLSPYIEQGYDLVFVTRAAAGALGKGEAFGAVMDEMRLLLERRRLLNIRADDVTEVDA